MPSSIWNPTDVEPVAAQELQAHVRRCAVSSSLPLTVSEHDLIHMESLFWQTYDGQASRGQAIFARLVCLQPILAARRLADLMSTCRDQTLDAACTMAATMPLNMQWGFNRHNLISAIRRAMAGSTTDDSEAIAEAA